MSEIFQLLEQLEVIFFQCINKWMYGRGVSRAQNKIVWPPFKTLYLHQFDSKWLYKVNPGSLALERLALNENRLAKSIQIDEHVFLRFKTAPRKV